MTKINEIFDSVQGEGLYVGSRQLFVRFCECNLCCDFCDTEFKNGKEYTPSSLLEYLTKAYNLEEFHSISLTGGEPLMNIDFLIEFLERYRQIPQRPLVYLETNATLYDEFVKIKEFVDIVSADIKLKSATGLDCFNLHEKFFKNCSGVKTFAKIVFDEKITNEEIEKSIHLARISGMELILQPKMSGDKMSISAEFCYEILCKFLKKYSSVRLIPQVHKFLNVR